ncbi:MAG: alanine--tRNA ligase [Candidatus Marinimicrobia bacterium]|nr:alanine--tRNA ligase [Candidatus Neomarinimicrobiota bacterium]
MNSKEIRKSFIDYFEGRGHRFTRSSSVVPIDDPTLLFTNAGMNQFKPIFLDQTKASHPRAVNSQKCIRVSGKHNDLEEVGVDTFHHTFFEMLGNWSFGDYYKKEAIEWAWDLFTKEWKLDKQRLWATVYEDDDEAFELWKEVTDIDSDRVIRCGKKDNFWEMGETGPCGPCSEIHYFIGDDVQEQDSSGVNSSDQYWELWNLVFIQSNRLSDGSLEDLPAKHVDTGAGLERIATILQGKTSNYDTDLFLPIIESLQDIAGSSYDEDPIPHRVIADHIRMLCFSIADGALPSNEGRGYVLRRILRRAARFGRRLGLENPFLYQLVDVMAEMMSDIYPEVVEKRSHIEKVIRSEEESFNQTLDRGLNHFEKIISSIGDGKELSGAEAFKLYDTYGFPLDLTQLLARERELAVDEIGFNELMDAQKKKAKEAKKFNNDPDSVEWVDVTEGGDSEFVGYDVFVSESKIRRYAESEGGLLLVLDKTPFYAESGGQIGDLGTIKGSNVALKVLDVKKDKESFIHICDGELKDLEDTFECSVDIVHRNSVRKNHTATHLMHKALKQVLGDHVNQAGSLVHSDHLRFDLTHFEKISIDEIVEIENRVNEQILINTEVDVTIQGFDDAKNAGAEALFGEKYGDEVRVVKVGDYSMELCGGTHVDRTGDIGSFKITDETSLASGVRRIVAVTGTKAISKMQKNAAILDELQMILNTPPKGMADRIKGLLKDKKELEKRLRSRPNNGLADVNIMEQIEAIGEYGSLVTRSNVPNMDELKSLGDNIFNKLSSGVAVLFSEGEEKPMAVIVVSKDLNGQGILASDIAKTIGGFMGGGGGGKPHLATAGGKDNDAIDDAIISTKEFINEILNR